MQRVSQQHGIRAVIRPRLWVTATAVVLIGLLVMSSWIGGGDVTATTNVAFTSSMIQDDVTESEAWKEDRESMHAATSAEGWAPHRWPKGGDICFGPLQAWMPCDDKLHCEYKGRMSFPCRERRYYDTLGWDFCDPAARLNRSVYIMNPPWDVGNDSVTDTMVMSAISLPLRRIWTAKEPSFWPSVHELVDPNGIAAVKMRLSRAQQEERMNKSLSAPDRKAATRSSPFTSSPSAATLVQCPPSQRRAVVGFAAKHMRPFQVAALVLSGIRVFSPAAPASSDEPFALTNLPFCTRMHLFVSEPRHSLLLHLRALGTPGIDRDAVFNMTPDALLTAEKEGRFDESFLQLENFDEMERRLSKTAADAVGNNKRVEVVRVNVARQWMRHGAGRKYRSLIFTDTRDAVFVRDVFEDMSRFLRPSIHATSEFSRSNGYEWEEYVFAASEEFPFFRQPGLGMEWNIQVHSTTFGVRMMELLQKLHLSGYPFMRLINSGVYGGTYAALLDLLEVWGASTAAVHTETFGVDQPLLGGLLYAGLQLMAFPHPAFLLSGSDGPLRHLYPDGGSDPRYPHMRLRLPNGTVIRSGQWMRQFPDEESAVGTAVELDGNIEHLNCDGVPYAVIHQADRYPIIWKGLTEPITRDTITWARLHAVEFTWGPRKGRKLRKRGL